jgi:sortase A
MNRIRARLTGLLAELLIIGGAGVGLFTVWSAWWTDVTGVASQAAMVDELGQVPTAAGGVASDGPPPVLDEPAATGAIFGTMQIPRFGAEYIRPLGQGTDRAQVLNTIGLGHYEHAAMPGAVGNFSVAGHRVTYGKPLNQIAELQEGDPIVVRVTDHERDFDVWYVYRVTGSMVVTPDRVDTIAPVPMQPGVAPGDDDRWLTLTACHPMWSAAERYVTHAKFESWMPASAGTPDALTEALR